MGEKEFSSRPGQCGALSSEAQIVLRIYLLTKEQGKERKLVKTLRFSLANHENLSQDLSAQETKL
jgi:hypothetical protein